MDYFDAISIVIYAGQPVLMYRWTGDTVWHSVPLS